jgi:hypothetical protein
MIKNLLKRILRRIARLPVIGRYIRMAAALYRLAAMAERGQALPGDLQRVVETAGGTDQDNLTMSVPVQLRKIQRELKRLQARIDELENARKQAS